jgi:hypothetical protein
MPLRTGNRGKVAKELALLRNLAGDRREASLLAFQKVHVVRKPKASVKLLPKRPAGGHKN